MLQTGFLKVEDKYEVKFDLSISNDTKLNS